MITYSGIHVTREFGAPTIRDIAVQSMRMYRFCGSGETLWPIGMHLMLVADLVTDDLKHHALLHDAAEIVVADVPRPMKTPAARKIEHRVTERIYESLGLRMPTAREEALVKFADIRAVNVEGRAGYGPRGFEDTQPGIDYSDFRALDLFSNYMMHFDAAGALNPNNYWVLELERRIRVALRDVREHKKYAGQYTKAA